MGFALCKQLCNYCVSLLTNPDLDVHVCANYRKVKSNGALIHAARNVQTELKLAVQLLEASTLITVWLPHFGRPPSLRAEREQGNTEDGSGSLSESTATLELTMTSL